MVTHAAPQMATEDRDRLLQRSKQLEGQFGHPQEMWDDLTRRVQEDAITQFRDVQDEWLRLMWAIDGYRIAGVPPRAMGKATVESRERLAAIYRSKGNWFATLLALLLQNRTEQQIRPRVRVQGFSQPHQIDLAWPARHEDPLFCVETKVTGAPAFGTTPSRSALADFSNRRKELKFAATDLKLFRRQQATSIEHWGAWREKAPPKTYFLWAARLRGDGRGSRDEIGRLIIEAQALVNTYLEGAGICAWRERSDHSGYEAVAIPPSARVTELDDVLYRIASEIREIARAEGGAPAPVRPPEKAVDIQQLAPDKSDGEEE
jgi:hypothetical protein